MENLQVTKEKILEAASKSTQAKEVLEVLFPEAFIEDKSVIISDNETLGDGSFNSKKLITNKLIAIRIYGDYKNKSFCLNSEYNWVIKEDGFGAICLIPTKII